MINVKCICGKTYNVPDEWAGKTAKCKSCGVRLAVSAQESNDVPPQKRRTIVIVASVSCFALILIGSGAFIAATRRDAPKEVDSTVIVQGKKPSTVTMVVQQDAKKEKTQEELIVDAGQKSVTNRLKSPITASYTEDAMIIPAKGQGGMWYVIGYVDSQNGFGAMIRNPYIVIVLEGTKGFCGGIACVGEDEVSTAARAWKLAPEEYIKN